MSAFLQAIAKYSPDQPRDERGRWVDWLRGNDGKPLRLYHGGKTQHVRSGGFKGGRGIFFTPDYAGALKFSQEVNYEKPPPPIEAYLRLRNPLRTNQYREAFSIGPLDIEHWESKGHDGIVYTDEQGQIQTVIAFHPKQVQILKTETVVEKFDPDQPRAPKGSPDGGQWTADSYQGPAFSLKKTRVGEGVAHQIMVNGTRVGHISGFERSESFKEGDEWRHVNVFEVYKTELSHEPMKGTGLYRQALQQVADQYSGGAYTKDWWSSTALKKSIRKMPTFEQIDDRMYVRPSIKKYDPSQPRVSKFDPDQPRAPKGTEEGGRWVKDWSAYMTMAEGAQLVDVAQLQPSKRTEDNEARIQRAMGFFEQAQRGEIERRGPLLVEQQADGTYLVLNGNSTYKAAKRIGLQQVPVIVAPAGGVKKYDPSQPRHPAGSSEGGRWIAGHTAAARAALLENPKRMMHYSTGEVAFLTYDDGSYTAWKATPWGNTGALRSSTMWHSHLGISHDMASPLIGDTFSAEDVRLIFGDYLKRGIRRHALIVSSTEYDVIEVPAGFRVPKGFGIAIKGSLAPDYDSRAWWEQENSGRPELAQYRTAEALRRREALRKLAVDFRFTYRERLPLAEGVSKWDETSVNRHPAGAPDSKGGEFAPKLQGPQTITIETWEYKRPNVRGTAQLSVIFNPTQQELKRWAGRDIERVRFLNTPQGAVFWDALEALHQQVAHAIRDHFKEPVSGEFALRELGSTRHDYLFPKLSKSASFMRRVMSLLKFDPSQPRHPKGTPEGGQWADDIRGPSIPSIEDFSDESMAPGQPMPAKFYAFRLAFDPETRDREPWLYAGKLRGVLSHWASMDEKNMPAGDYLTLYEITPGPDAVWGEYRARMNQYVHLSLPADSKAGYWQGGISVPPMVPRRLVSSVPINEVATLGDWWEGKLTITREELMARLLDGQSRALLKFDETKVNRGKTTPESNEGSFAPRGTGFVSPNIDENVDFSEAMGRITSDRTKLLLEANREIDQYYNLSTANSVGVGAWADGAEQSIVARFANGDADRIKASMALKGLVSEQKAVVSFTNGADGADTMYRFSVGTQPMPEIHKAMLENGVAFHTLVPTRTGVDVYVFSQGTDKETLDGLDKATRQLGGEGHQAWRGTGEFVGSWDSRDEGAAEYERVLDAYERKQDRVAGPDAGWRRIRNNWLPQLKEVKKAASFLEKVTLVAKTWGVRT